MTANSLRKSIFIVLCVIALLPFSLKAQDTLIVSLDKAIEIALSESPTIKVANKEIQRVDYSSKEKISALFPVISASGQYSRAVKKQKLFFNIPGMPARPDGIEVGQDNTFSGGISAAMPLIAPTLWATIKMSELDAQLVMESARSSKLSLVNEVSKAYYAILLAQDSYDVFKKSYDIAVENAKIIENKYKQGTVSEFEWIRADVQVKNANANLVSAENAVNLSVLRLKMLMGIDMFIGLKVEGNLSNYEANKYADVLSIDTTTLKSNSDLKQFDIKAQQLKQSLKIQKSTNLPTLSAAINYQYMSMADDSIAFSNYHWFPTSTAALSLSIPLFQGGGKLFKQKQIEIQVEEMKYQRDNLRRGLELQAMSYLDNINQSLKVIESNKEGLRQAEKALSISQKRYEVGAATYLDLSNAELAYTQAGLSYNQSIYNYLSAKADLEKLLGNQIIF
ncbi:MAG: TolC family protein [Paludibacteraceae bacterium]|jgi:outer membrane protein TolC|nr:TolC family protein [Paludibacteraceae bacterium]OPZ02513.1 MAG: Outer membrane protein TolC precursor [Bacteroidetes bacterium ADurb.BinA395]HOF99020.1 TolC family protein [Paludibacteraceae bacterium]HON02881.1 TolC family protein [Paludibacteraceae bacterium]HPL76076.1 TolC family protein [Paludibacteraceae bacterium]